MKYISYIIIAFLFIISCKNATASNTNDIVNTLLFSKESAYQYIKLQTDLGPRNYGSEAHKKVRELLKSEMINMGYEVYSHKFNAPKIKNRAGENIYAFLEGNEKKNEYIVIASHYDSRSVAEKDADTSKRNSPIIGANDGGSSTGVLLELMRVLKNYKLPYSICFVLFDLEDDGNLFDVDGNNILDTDWIQGSIAFVDENVIDLKKIKFGILLDIVGGENANFKYESISHTYFSSIYNEVWNTAQLLGYTNYFRNYSSGSILDDHIPFVLKSIPFIDIIDINYKYHHTTEDTLDKIDKNTLEAVGKTVEYFIKNLK